MDRSVRGSGEDPAMTFFLDAERATSGEGESEGKGLGADELRKLRTRSVGSRNYAELLVSS